MQWEAGRYKQQKLEKHFSELLEAHREMIVDPNHDKTQLEQLEVSIEDLGIVIEARERHWRHRHAPHLVKEFAAFRLYPRPKITTKMETYETVIPYKSKEQQQRENGATNGTATTKEAGGSSAARTKDNPFAIA